MKQIKLKQNNIKVKAKATENKKMTEYTTFWDGGRNSLSNIKSKLLVSYSNFPFKKWISWQSLQFSLQYRALLSHPSA